MNRNFSIQINPELILKLTEPDRHPQGRRHRLPTSLAPRNPKPQPQPQSPPPQPALQPAPFLSLAPSPLPGFTSPSLDSPDSELEPFRKTLEKCEQALETLRKQEESDLEDVRRRARELHEKQYRVHEPKSVPCQEAKQACIRCYQENAKEPLKCADSVRAYAECARQVRQRFVAAGFD